MCEVARAIPKATSNNGYCDFFSLVPDYASFFKPRAWGPEECYRSRDRQFLGLVVVIVNYN